MKKINNKSMDIVAENINKLKELFPEAFSEDKINFDILKEILGNYVDDQNERYNFTWNGKSEARIIAQTQSKGTLRPCFKESVDWEKTRNIFIEGDNLEVLKLLQKSYYKKVKLIYIDPPYNTGKDFVYKDNFKDNIKNYKKITGQVDSNGRSLISNPETSGRYHTNWLNMMYPRLKLARNLLKNDGVIFISIDDGEVANLRKICDDVFGEENFIANVIWQKKYTRSNDAKWFSDNHDHVLCYGKNKLDISLNMLPRNKAQSAAYGNPDNHPKGIWKATPLHAKSGSNTSGYTFKNGIIWTPPKGTFRRFNDKSMKKMDDADEIWFGNKRSQTPSRKSFLCEVKDGVTPVTLWPYDEVGHNHEANNELKALELGGLFNNPKPTRLLKRIFSLASNKDDIILDFFAGSGSSAHAAMKLNMEDEGNRRFILVQLPEPCDIKSESFKAGYNTIAEISKERIRRAADNIKEKNTNYKVDLGFRIFKLDSSNFKPWDANLKNLDENLLEQNVNNIKSSRSEKDVLYEVLLKYGLDLTLNIKEHMFAEQKVYNIGMGTLIVCLSNTITLELIECIVRLKDELKPEFMHVVLKDSGFKDDVIKTNAIQILKQANIKNVRSL